MKAIGRRILKLEDRISPGEPPHLVMVCRAESEGILDTKKCIEILGKYGFLPTAPGFGHIVNLLDVPDDLNAEELEKYLRENGAQTRVCQCTQK